VKTAVFGANNGMTTSVISIQKPKKEFAPLHRIDIHKVLDDKRFQPSIVFTPTFIILEDGAEVARIEGYPGEDFFWQLLNQALLKHSKYKETEK
jgi:hypothetical protein